MFQATRQRLALWYSAVTAVLLLLFATGFYLYVRHTLVERVDDTLNHVVEVVQRSIVVESADDPAQSPFRLNLEASFGNNAVTAEDDHIDLEWFNPTGDLLWSTLDTPLNLPVHPSSGETVHQTDRLLLRQVTQRVEVGRQVLGYLRVSHPWFEVAKPSRQLIFDLSLGIVLMVGIVTAIGWFLSGLAMAPVRDSYQRLKQFTADASHELRNPIAVIQTNVQVALADPDPDLQHQQLEVVERLTRRLGRLVDDLLFLARQDSASPSRQRFTIAPRRSDRLDLAELLSEVVQEQQSIASEKNIAFSLNTSGELEIAGDRDQLTRLFTNLLSNAVQYTPSGGKVEVTATRHKHLGQLEIQVQDTGIGIPAEAIPHLFDRFYRVDSARSRQQAGATSGSGLGLAIAKTIVEAHQGEIQVDSIPNQGTCFTVMLPSL